MKVKDLFDKHEAEVMYPVIRRLVEIGYITGGVKKLDKIIASFTWHFNMTKRSLHTRSTEWTIRIRNEKELKGVDDYLDMTKEELLEYAARKHSFILVTGTLDDEDCVIAELDSYNLWYFENAVFSYDATEYWSEAELLTIFLYESLYLGFVRWQPKRKTYRKALMKDLYKKITKRGSIYKKPPFKLSSLGESMRIVKSKINDWYMPRFILDDERQVAYEVVNEDSTFMLADVYDMNMLLLNNMFPYPESCLFRYLAYIPTNIKKFRSGVAEVTWRMNAAGEYYNFDRPEHEHHEMTAFIDKKCRVVMPFQCMAFSKVIKEKRKEAERIVATQFYDASIRTP